MEKVINKTQITQQRGQKTTLSKSSEYSADSSNRFKRSTANDEQLICNIPIIMTL